MAQPDKKPNEATEQDIDAPRLTPQGREDPSGNGQDSTKPFGQGEKKGQSDKPEG